MVRVLERVTFLRGTRSVRVLVRVFQKCPHKWRERVLCVLFLPENAFSYQKYAFFGVLSSRERVRAGYGRVTGGLCARVGGLWAGYYGLFCVLATSRVPDLACCHKQILKVHMIAGLITLCSLRTSCSKCKLCWHNNSSCIRNLRESTSPAVDVTVYTHTLRMFTANLVIFEE